jgi:hypothetical protein
MMARTRARVSLNPALRKLGQQAGRDSFPGLVRAVLVAWVRRVWYRKYLPRHFTNQAYTLYPYAYVPRTRAYNQRKRARKIAGATGEVKPWVLTGRTRQTILGGRPRFKQPRGRRSVNVTARLPHAAAGNFWPPRRKHDFAGAMTALAASEQEHLRRYLETELARRIRAVLAAGGRGMRSAA